jgi:hypothetical protein
MQIGNFSVTIPQGREREGGYVHLDHGTQYTIQLYNGYSHRRCDAEVTIDGKVIGVFRVGTHAVTLERAPHDRGRFTYYKVDSQEAKQSGVDKISTSDRGLIRVRFRAEKPVSRPYQSHRSRGFQYDDAVTLESMGGGDERKSLGPDVECYPCSAPRRGQHTNSTVGSRSAGMTGVSGYSGQNFDEVPDLDYDSSTETIITLRLVTEEPIYAARPEPRELTPAPKGNRVPDPV